MDEYEIEAEALMLGQAEGPGPSAGTVCGPGEALDLKTGECIKGGLPPGFVAPGEVAVRPGNWDTDKEPARYRLHAGDTYAGLAATYLGSNTRWREIWDLNRAQHPSPDRIFAGQIIKMPDEAKKTFLKKSGKGGGDLKSVLPYLGVAAAAALAAYYLA